MRHDIHLEGFNVRLRPVRVEDAAFITWLRNQDYVKGRVGDSAQSVRAQEAWLKTYFEREGDYYFIVETLRGISLGTHGIYDVAGSSAEKGRHIIRPEIVAGLPNGILLVDYAFENMGLTEIRSNCVSTNIPLHSLHRKSGFKRVGVKQAAQMIDGQPVDLVQYLLTAEDWNKVRDSLLPLATLAGVQVLDWEKTQLGRTQPWEEIHQPTAV
ncbi:MAG TPA: GNAT family protein [Verrucomicrobiae bacterium]|nr:GNAT family protein [Verrucomicrobiae bacterium]